MHKMTKILHQQQLLLELLCMSGNIAVTESNDGTILRKTLMETKAAGWITLTPFGKGFDMAAITDFGRRVIEGCLSVQAESPSIGTKVDRGI